MRRRKGGYRDDDEGKHKKEEKGGYDANEEGKDDDEEARRQGQYPGSNSRLAPSILL